MKSLSNLYKQWFITEEPAKKRVINSNERLRERMEEIRKETERKHMEEARIAREAEGGGAETGNDGFTPGLFAEDVKVFTEEEADSLYAETTEKTEQMLAEAREQADAIISNAGIQAEQLKSQAREQGYNEGLAKGREDAEAENRGVREALQEERTLFEEERARKLRDMEPELLDIMLEVFNKVFHIQFDDKKEILEYLIVNTIMNIEGCRTFRIHASEDNYPYIASHLKDIQTKAGTEYSVDVVSDGAVEENKCIIETDSGMFDCSLGVHLDNLMKDLKSLCS